ncbi:unnamed protein product [Effrenium voratum]|uniref:Uncharacterized protein n=1 Tax=Effrenium voratum TaxID=2562239 RepID=A0AA36N1E9_9DINO|nr:unnamed protein product [Effrenium voratum]
MKLFVTVLPLLLVQLLDGDLHAFTQHLLPTIVPCGPNCCKQLVGCSKLQLLREQLLAPTAPCLSPKSGAEECKDISNCWIYRVGWLRLSKRISNQADMSRYI